jgi:flagellar hook assembly protein FlgD
MGFENEHVRKIGERGVIGDDARKANLSIAVIAYASHLSAAQPNPFGMTTTIPIHLDRAGRVKLVVYDVRGRRVRTLAAAPFEAGTHRIEWNGRDGAGKNVSAGVYFVTLSADNKVTTREVVRLR